MWVYLIIGLLFIGTGLAVHVFKWYFLIAGYNTMPKEKKKNVDTKSLGRLMGLYSYANGGVFILMGILDALNLIVGLTFGVVFFGVSTIYLLVKAQKYDGNRYDVNGKLKKESWKQGTIGRAIAVIAFIFVGVLLIFSSQPTKVTILEEGVQIHGMYGEVYAWESIQEIKLVEELPTIQRRTNGSAVGPNLKGHFQTKELGAVKLFVNTKKQPYIFLETDKRVVFFNLKDEETTRQIYEEITEKLNN